MLDSEVKRFIMMEIQKQLNVIASGSAGANTVETENINALFPGMPPLEGRPVMHPYGFVSRAAVDTISVTARQGNHPGAYLTLGHRDKNRPAIENGESAIYSIGKFQITAKTDKILIGKDGVFEELVMGETLRQFLLELVVLVLEHTHIGNLNYPTGVPINSQGFEDLKGEYLDNSKILAKNSGRF